MNFNFTVFENNYCYIQRRCTEPIDTFGLVDMLVSYDVHYSKETVPVLVSYTLVSYEPVLVWDLESVDLVFDGACAKLTLC